jgi:hypothetical protein
MRWRHDAACLPAPDGVSVRKRRELDPFAGTRPRPHSVRRQIAGDGAPQFNPFGWIQDVLAQERFIHLGRATPRCRVIARQPILTLHDDLQRALRRCRIQNPGNAKARRRGRAMNIRPMAGETGVGNGATP